LSGLSCKNRTNTGIIILTIICCVLLQTGRLDAQSEWRESESEHFKIIYQEYYSDLIPHLLRSAENSLATLKQIFDYEPKNKILIIAYDFYDYGFGSTTTIPQDVIRLEIEPFEPGYENIPYNDRFQWVISHELVHVLVDDNASSIEKTFRSIFGKVEPEQNQPLTVLYSLLTNYNRYTPRWHQEAIAVFMETWLSGGYGRILGNFDEMYFRTLVLNKIKFSSDLKLDAMDSQNSFLLESIFYLYGARFAAYLAVKYGPDKLIDWFKTKSNECYASYVARFKDDFGIDFNEAWNNFIETEKKFQNSNITKVEENKLTALDVLNDKPMGWVTKPYYYKNSILFGYDKPGKLASVTKLNLKSHHYKYISTLPTPSLLQVASTAFDDSLGYFFYTTNNSQFYRDIWVMDIKSGDKKELFKDARAGDLTVSPVTHELWGMEHSGGKMFLVYSPLPYNELIPLVTFSPGDNVYELSVSPFGKYLAAVLHRKDGEQSIILASCAGLKEGKGFQFQTLYTKGSPEDPSWSSDGKYIFWSAYTNGVSNIYKYDVKSSSVEPITNVVSGLFKPIYLNEDSLFVFKFTTNGFVPVIIPNKQAEGLAAIDYYGEKIVDQNPKITSWALGPADEKEADLKIDSTDYSGIGNLHLNTIIPEVTGFQSQKVLGIYAHIADPLLFNDLTLEFGVSPFDRKPGEPLYHFKGKYEYKKKYEVALDYNAPDFYDLFNNRKRGMIGTKLTLADTYYWIYDNPLKVQQKTEVDYYTGIKSLNDNLVQVSQSDFIVAQTNLNSKDLRRSIGSVE
jgi:WD40-like Beta Propeller Repeat